MHFKSNASTRACVRSDDRNVKQNAIIAMAQATLEGFAKRTQQERARHMSNHRPSALSKVTAFRSRGFPTSCRTISSVLGVHIPLKIWWPDHTFVKNRVVWHWGACHLLRSCRLFNVRNHMFGYHVLPQWGVATIMPLVKRTLSVRRIVSCSLSL